MSLNRRVAVIGSAVVAPFAGGDRSLEEVLYDVSRRALADAGLTMDGIDGIVVGSNDQFDGRAIAVMAASGSVGGVDRDILSTPSAGEHAFVMGVLRIASGHYETHLVVSWSPLEASSLPEAQRLGADPYFHRRLPLDDASTFALQGAALAAAWPAAGALADRIMEHRRAHAGVSPDGAGAARPPWPLKEGMLPPMASGAVALVIASQDHVRRHGVANPVWVRGMGWATEPAFLGDRDLSTAPALKEAARRAYDEAGIGDPRDAVAMAEICGVTPYQELIAYDALGLSRREDWDEDVRSGRFLPSGRLPVNPSGGVAALYPVFCAGLMRIEAVARRLRGQREAAGLAHAASGPAMMYQTVLVLGTDAGEARK